MKKILVLLVGMLLLLSNKAFAMEPYINIISPNGGEVYQPGQQITVKWKTNDYGDKKILIAFDLITNEDGGAQNTFLISKSGLENDGIEIVTIPLNTPAKDNYMFRITTSDASYLGGSYDPYYRVDKSDGTFKIDSSIQTVNDPSIKVLSPNGGETYNFGERFKVKWVSKNITSKKYNILLLNYYYNQPCKIGTVDVLDGYFTTTLSTDSCLEYHFEKPDLLPGKYKIFINDPTTGDEWLSDSSDDYFTINNPDIIQEDTEHAVTYTSDLTPRISVWQGKVNQHVDIDNKMWNTDPDGTSGAEIDKLTYCKKWYPKTVSVEEYKKETIKAWHDAGNVNAYNSTRMSYKCNQESASVLPSTFTMKITSDMTSSGASRDYSARLAFVNGTLVSGTETYKVGEGGGCVTNCNRQNTCVIKNGAWVDSLTGGICSISNFIPLTRSELESKIVDKKILNKKDCGHNDICYELVGNETSTISTTKINRTLKRGLRGDDVKRLQEFLGLKADGIFGYGTANAVKKWQSQNGLTADGLFGSYSRVKAGLNN